MSVAVTPVPSRSSRLGIAAVPLFCLLWSSAFVAGKIGVTDCPPLIFLAVRFLAAGVLILGLAVLGGERFDLRGRDIAAFALIGIFNNALYLGLGYVGLRSISSGLNALIVSANPVFTAVLAARLLGERITLRKVIGLVLGIIGVAIVVADRIQGGSDSPVGVAFSMGALAAIVGGTILFKRLAPQGSLWIGNGIQNLAGGLAVAPFAYVFSDVADIVPSARLMAAWLYLIVGGSIVAYLLWFRLLTAYGATGASALHFLMPPLGMLFGWAILGEKLAPDDLLGVIPVALGIYLVTRASGKPPANTSFSVSRSSRPGDDT